MEVLELTPKTVEQMTDEEVELIFSVRMSPGEHPLTLGEVALLERYRKLHPENWYEEEKQP